jgi:4-amino-4-deoxy-L-arabinose transferase-like glycosyltransferase
VDAWTVVDRYPHSNRQRSCSSNGVKLLRIRLSHFPIIDRQDFIREMNDKPNLRTNGLPGTQIAHATLIAALGTIFVALGWTGYLQSDDLEYARAAQGWLSDFPFVGESHWALRHAIVLPVATMFGVFGVSEMSLIAPIVLYAATLIAVVYAAARWSGDALTGVLCALVLISVPIVSEGASMVVTDSVEALFVVLSLLSFLVAAQRQASWQWLVVSGVFAGLAFITRETMIALLICYAFLFLKGYSGRYPYFVMAAGFFVVVLTDALYLGLATGDPFYRFTISLKGVAGDNPAISSLASVKDGFDRHGLLAAPAALQPILMILANRSFGPLFWVAIPAAVFVLKSADLPPRARELAKLSVLLAVTWFLVLSYALYWLWDVPRYQTVPVVMAAIIIGLWLRYVIWPFRPRVALLVLASLLLLNAALISLANKEPLFGERALTLLALASSDTLHTDPSTLEGAEFLLEVAHVRDRVTSNPPKGGDLYVYNSRPYRRRPHLSGPLVPGDDWIAQKTIDEEPKLVARALDFSGLIHMLPRAVANKLAPPLRQVIIYRLPVDERSPTTR